MSERIHHDNHESARSNEQFDIAKEVEASLKKLETESNTADKESENKTEAARASAEKEAKSAKETKGNRDTTEKTADRHVIFSHAKLKQETYQKTLSEIQQQLPKLQRMFSLFSHKPVIETVSEAASKTIARPVGIAWASIFTFFGISITLLLAYRYGFAFNYLLFGLLFVATYLLTTLLELTYKKLFAKKFSQL